MKWTKKLAKCISALLILSVCVARGEQGLVLLGNHLRGASDQPNTPAALHRPLPQQAALDTNIEYAVDYDHDLPYYSDEAVEQPEMTYSTYYPQQGSKPCHMGHHQHEHHQQLWPLQGAATFLHDAAAAAADAADADVLVAAANHAWKKAQQLAARLAAVDAAETAELISELESTIERMEQTQLAADDIIDHRWDEFDGTERSFLSDALADYINPARQYVSGLDYYLPDEDDAHATPSEDFYGYDATESVAELTDAQPAPLPTGLSTPSAAAYATLMTPDEDDIGLFILPGDNAANNLALFGVRSPAEVAAAAAAAAPGAQYGRSSSSWPGLMEWLSGVSYEPVHARRAAAALIVGSTIMVLVVFVFNLVQLRATLQAAAGADSGDSAPSTRRYAMAPAGALHLRTCKSSFAGCSAVAAAAAAAVGVSCGLHQQESGRQSCDELMQPLLLDEDDLEAAVLQAGPSVVLPPVMQKFYNPMHYQQLPGGDE